MPEFDPRIAALIALVALFPVTMWLFAELSGWRKLHRRYGSPSWPVPKGSHLQTGKLGKIQYSNLLFVASDPAGLYIGVFPLCRFAHPTLFIPWDQFHRIRFSGHVILDDIVCSIGEPRITRLRLPHKSVKGTLLDPNATTGHGLRSADEVLS